MLGSLRSIEIRERYTTDSCKQEDITILKDFIIPCLSCSIRYDRISAFFSSEVFVYLFQGIKEFVNNGGKMNLLLGSIPNKEFRIANASEEERKNFYEEDIIERIFNEDEISDKELKKSIFNILAWLIDRSHLEIRLGFILNKDYKLANQEEIMIELERGMLHDKLGIFTDHNDDQVGFSGSLNETKSAYIDHVEGIETHQSWKLYPNDNENKHLKSYLEEFNTFWENKGKRLRVYKFPDKSLKKIIKHAPKEFPEGDYKIISRFYREAEEEIGESNDPFKYIKWKQPQIDGYSRWLANNRKGILSIATGVGKTLIAIRAIHEYILENQDTKSIVLIGVHSKPMIYQWREEINYWLNKDYLPDVFKRLIMISGDKGNIQNQLDELGLKLNLFKNIIIISHYDTLCSKIVPFLESKTKWDIFFVADEVHEVGTKLKQKQLENFIPHYLLGLTATPKRYFDPVGTQFLETYFDGIVYEYLLSNAIEHKYLCEYNYYPVFCELNKKEIKKYNSLSKAIAIQLSRDKPNHEELNQLYRIRKKIIKKAEDKYKKVKQTYVDIKKNIPSPRVTHMLIYLEEIRQLEKVRSNLVDENIAVRIITNETTSEMRLKFINQLRNGTISVILAIGILDQGINIPELKYGIFTSSTGNEKQFIQRRGRLLRIDKRTNKDRAYIYDLIVPFVDIGNIIESEIYRAKIFYGDCSNKGEVEGFFMNLSIDIKTIKIFDKN